MTVGYEVRDSIAYISFNRPDKHNALRDADIIALVAALDRLDQDDDARLGIIFGHGRSFSSGGDVSERLQASMDEGTSARPHEGDAFLRCANWKPVIAAVHGYCLGHGLGLALQCDLLVAARSARFQVTEIKIGLPMASFIPRLGRPAFANDVCLSGRMFDGTEAWDAGFVTRLADEGEHLREAESLARLILGNPQAAVREHVRAHRTVRAREVAQYADLTKGFSETWATNAEARTAVAARSAELHAKG